MELPSPTTNHVIALQLVVCFVFVVGFQVAVARFQIEREAKRRWQHLLTGHAFVVVSYVLPISYCIPALLAGAAGMYYMRFYQSELFMKTFGPLLRSHEKEGTQLPGAFFFLLGTALTALIFPIRAARYAVECLAVVDPVAAWIGQSIKSPRINSRSSLAGSAACFVTAGIIGHLYSLPLACIAAGATACCLAEASPIGNDDIVIPIASALAVSMFLRHTP